MRSLRGATTCTFWRRLALCAVLIVGTVWAGLVRRLRPGRRLRIGTFDRHESADALPGGAAVVRTDSGELALAGRGRRTRAD